MSLFKEPFDEEIKTQLGKRQDLIDKHSYLPQDLVYLNSKTSWIQLRSSVDIDTDYTKASSLLAKDNVLLGGTLYNKKFKKGIGDSIDNAYSNTTYNRSDPTKNVSTLYGLRPAPGITGVSIKNKGAYGSLRQATISFQCWDVSQLEILETLYMRPGYTVLLEWGWLPYVDNYGALSSELYDDQSFFNRKNIDPQEYFKELRNNVIKSHGNYDFMYGYVMNYSWKLRDDGGYDCSTEVISVGEVLDSYKINFSGSEIAAKGLNQNGTIFSEKINKSYIEQVREDYKKNILTGIYAEIFQVIKDSEQKNNNAGVGIIPYQYNDKKCDIHYAALDIELADEGTENQSEIQGYITDSNSNYYITLGSLVDIFNNFILFKSTKNDKKPNLVSLSLKNRLYLPNYSKSIESLQGLYHPYQISVNPEVCIIRNDNFSKLLSGLYITPDPEKSLKVNPNSISTDLNFSYSTKLQKLTKQFPNDNGISSNIENIYINLRYLYELSISKTLESQDPSENGNINLMDYFRTMLKEIQTSIGSINNFEVYVEESVGYIIDLNVTSDVNFTKNKNQSDSVFTFEIGNRKSIVSNINLESKIFSNQSTIIAISSQVKGGVLEQENSTLVAYNRGLTDRTIQEKDINLISKQAEKDKSIKLQGIVDSVKSLVKFLRNTSIISPVRKESPSQYKSALKSVIKYFTANYKTKNKFKAILPTTISFDIDGIAGIVIGTIFDISKEVIPEAYKNVGAGLKLYYTVTGIEHKIDNNGRWITTIQGNPFIPDSSFDDSTTLAGDKFPPDFKNLLIEYGLTKSIMELINIELLKEPPAGLSGMEQAICVALNTVFGSSKGVEGKCARYTYNIARNMDLFLKGTEQSKLPIGEGAKFASGADSPKDENNWIDALIKIGWKEDTSLRQSNTKRENIASFTSGENFTPGDIVTYWSNKPTTHRNKKGEDTPNKYGHAQIYTGGAIWDSAQSSFVPPRIGIGSKWASSKSDNYAVFNGFVYGGDIPASGREEDNSWELRVYKRS